MTSGPDSNTQTCISSRTSAQRHTNVSLTAVSQQNLSETVCEKQVWPTQMQRRAIEVVASKVWFGKHVRHKSRASRGHIASQVQGGARHSVVFRKHSVRGNPK
jgi:hypothetical protein